MPVDPFYSALEVFGVAFEDFSDADDLDDLSSTSSCALSMSSQVPEERGAQRTSVAVKNEAERREKNRLAQQRYRRNLRSELLLMRNKAVKYFEREVQLYSQLARVSQEKNAVLAEVEAQKRLIAEMTNRLKVCAEEYGQLQTKFTVLVSAHCQLVQRTNAVAHPNAAVLANPINEPCTQAPPAAPDARLA